VLSAISVQHETREFCVISSAGKDLGCYLTRDGAEAQLQRTGQERLLQVIGTTARLEEREVLQTIAPGTPEFESTPVTCGTATEQATAACSFDALKDKTVVFLGPGGDKYRLGPVEITGDMIKRATALYGSGADGGTPGWKIDFTLTSSGGTTFGDVTTRLVGKQLAIVVDNVVISAPTIDEPITGGSGVITGSFTKARAQDLATQLNSGALPVNLKKEQVETVSPTLGRQSLHQGLVAGVVGLILLALYLLFYYRLLGLVAWLGMSIWAVLALALVSIAGRAFGYALTLAGVAGLVISLGVTADSYIVFFERLKDEVRHGRSPRAAVQPAFKRAYRTIVAADIVTALAAIILYVTAISSVRGFALTLGVATLLDLFVVYFFKRPTVFLIARNERLVNLHGFGLTSGVAAEPLKGEPVPVAGGSK
jgi:preprotein translocase subunit SecD